MNSSGRAEEHYWAYKHSKDYAISAFRIEGAHLPAELGSRAGSKEIATRPEAWSFPVGSRETAARFETMDSPLGSKETAG